MYALLLISDDDMSLDDIAATIGASKASASMNARLLEDKSLVVKISRTGDRRNYYRISPELFTCTMEQRLARWDRVRAVVGEGLVDSTLSTHARSRLREFDKASEGIREVLEAALKKLRSRGKS